MNEMTELQINRTDELAKKTPIEFLNTLFLERKSENPSYSTRSFAHDLGISQALLSLVLNGKRPLSVKLAAQIGVLLKFSDDETDDFIRSSLKNANLKQLHNQHAQHDQKVSSNGENGSVESTGSVGSTGSTILNRFFIFDDIEKFQVISQWHHLAILDLATTKNCRNDPHWIARRLNISEALARDAIGRLQKLGMLKINGKQLKKTRNKIFFESRQSEAAVRSFHSQMMEKAMKELRDIRPDRFKAREISGVTMGVAKARIPEARKKIRQFYSEMSDFLTEGDADEVYQLNVQLFPLTRDIDKKENE